MRSFAISGVPSPLTFEHLDSIGSRAQKIPHLADTELLRFGVLLSFICSQGFAEDPLEMERFRQLLGEARAEWKRRYPTLPLIHSF